MLEHGPKGQVTIRGGPPTKQIDGISENRKVGGAVTSSEGQNGQSLYM